MVGKELAARPEAGQLSRGVWEDEIYLLELCKGYFQPPDCFIVHLEKTIALILARSRYNSRIKLTEL